MKRILRYFSIVVAVTSTMSLGGCALFENETVSPQKTTIDRSIISPSCCFFGRTNYNSGQTTRSLIDQITTRQLDSNFLRVDEDIAADNSGLYTFNHMWNEATVVEATVISSPDNTPYRYFRTVTFAPTQAYPIYINSGDPLNPDTTFYHTRMIGWYPKNCTLPRNAQNKPVSALFDNTRFNGTRVDLGGDGTGVRFTGLDGSVDLMMSDLREGERWHLQKAGETNYRQPFGHSTEAPVYENYFTYKHYMTTVRVWAYADQSPQSLNTWGTINNLVFENQPSECIIKLPTTVGSFGTTYSWGEPVNMPAKTTLMYGSEDVNHQDDDYSTSYPISMTATSSSAAKYLGYCLLRPDHDVQIAIHTTAGTFKAIIPNTYTDTIAGVPTLHNIFEASKIYDIRLNLTTTGTIEVYLQHEDVENFKNLSPWNTELGIYETANCYIIDPATVASENLDGFCFNGTFIGNGEDGFISSGIQSFHTTSEIIDPHGAKLVWQSPSDLINEVELVHGYVRFQVPSSTVEGNAVVAVVDDSDNILWSWHIWITDTPSVQYFNINGTRVGVIDRNLGATAATYTSSADLLQTYGLYYQWGRKDPSPGPESYNYSTQDTRVATYYDYSATAQHYVSLYVVPFVATTIVDGIEHPLNFLLPTPTTMSDYYFNWLSEDISFLWGNAGKKKTIYDPCPFGYRVPVDEIDDILTGYSSISSSLVGNYGGLLVSHAGYDADGNSATIQAFFPSAGYKSSDRGLFDQEAGWRYVGLKGDYQGSEIATDDTYKGHRIRSYTSNTATAWTETSVGSYAAAYVNHDYTNRKTAASVRCIKE